MSNLQINTDGSQYADKMDNMLKETVTQWWDGLSKEELLAYIAEQPSITADHIRTMFANEQVKLKFEVNFLVAAREASADFHSTQD